MSNEDSGTCSPAKQIPKQKKKKLHGKERKKKKPSVAPVLSEEQLMEVYTQDNDTCV